MAKSFFFLASCALKTTGYMFVTLNKSQLKYALWTVVHQKMNNLNNQYKNPLKTQTYLPSNPLRLFLYLKMLCINCTMQRKTLEKNTRLTSSELLNTQNATNTSTLLSQKYVLQRWTDQREKTMSNKVYIITSCILSQQRCAIGYKGLFV